MVSGKSRRSGERFLEEKNQRLGCIPTWSFGQHRSVLRTLSGPTLRILWVLLLLPLPHHQLLSPSMQGRVSRSDLERWVVLPFLQLHTYLERPDPRGLLCAGSCNLRLILETSPFVNTSFGMLWGKVHRRTAESTAAQLPNGGAQTS